VSQWLGIGTDHRLVHGYSPLIGAPENRGPLASRSVVRHFAVLLKVGSEGARVHFDPQPRALRDLHHAVRADRRHTPTARATR
jgi:hypothetical protein